MKINQGIKIKFWRCFASLFAVLLFMVLLWLPSMGQAAVLYLEPSSGEYHQGDTFIVNARINPGGECVNTIQADLEFPKDSLEVKDVSKGNSILSFWVKEPEILQEAGLISFIGGIPGGYCGPLPGDPGKSNLLGRIVFQARAGQADAKVEFLESSQVLLNDGLGTPAKLSTREAVFAILPGVSEVPKKEWQEELEKDKTPPESFEVKVNKNPAIFEGKYFITFSTADKQTGIDHYDVKEGKKDWQKAESPYLLEDQTRQNKILVKAVDKAGNEKIAEYLPPQKPLLYWVIIFVLLGGAIWLLWKRKTKKSF